MPPVSSPHGRRRAARGAPRRGDGGGRRPRRPDRLGARRHPRRAVPVSTWRPMQRPSRCSRRPDSACCPRSPGIHDPDRALVVVHRSGRRVDQRAARHSLVRDQPVRGRRGGTAGGGRRQPGVRSPVRGGTRRRGPEGRCDRSVPSGCEKLDEAIVAFSGYPPRYLGWSQYRALGAAALDLCAVAEGSARRVRRGRRVAARQLGLPRRNAGLHRGRRCGRRACRDGPGRARPRGPEAPGGRVDFRHCSRRSGPPRRAVAFRFRAFSSVGRAAGLQPAGRRFESGSAHRPLQHKGSPKGRRGPQAGQGAWRRRRTTATERETGGPATGTGDGSQRSWVLMG